jgi:hypothetical protein
MSIDDAGEIRQLRSAELEAEQRYDEAIKRSDYAAAARASIAWKKAADALTERLEKTCPHGSVQEPGPSQQI